MEGWGQVLALASVLGTVDGDLTPAAIDEALGAFTGPQPFGLKSFSCPGPTSIPAVCGAGAAKAFRIQDYQLVPMDDVIVDFD